MDVMTTMLSLFILFTSASLGTCHELTWTWVQGSNTANVIGTKADPGGRSGAAYWVQQDNKTVWLFGGEHHVEHDQPGLKNDLWKLDLDTQQWTMVHNGTSSNMSTIPEPRQLASACGIPDSYFVLFGGLNEKEEPLSDTWLYYIPDNRWYTVNNIREKLVYKNNTKMEYPDHKGDAVFWCHGYLDMFVFGGFGKDQTLSHEMWRFDLAELTWEQVESSKKLPKEGEFVKHLLYPSGRSGGIKWTVGDVLYMFGGNVMDRNVRSKHLMIGNSGDLWQYSIKQDNWTYLMGPRDPCRRATFYGTVGEAGPDSYPGCRRQAASWVDERNNLWMFGGDGVDDSQESISVFSHSKLLSDLWHYDVKDFLWTWKGGSKSGDMKGHYGKLGLSDEDTMPGSRCESVFWSKGPIFYMYGGVGHDANGKDGYLNDAWELDAGSEAAVKVNAPEPWQVFAIMVTGIGLVVMLSVIFVLLRGTFKEKNRSDERGKYTRIDIEETGQ